MMETSLFYLINKGCANKVFDVIMPLISKAGSPEAMLIVAAALLFTKDKKKRNSGVVLFIGILISYVVVHFLKTWIARPRPFVVLTDAHLLDAGKMGFSFPSGHAATAFLTATILSAFFRRRALFFTVAIVICFSRVYIGVHFVSDVVAGAAIGAAIAYVVLRCLGQLCGKLEA